MRTGHKIAVPRHRWSERMWREKDGAIVEINSYGRAVIDSLPEGMKEGRREYES